ncbi:MAG: efflux RND transporter periplasmic adaptor subunit [Planctomycetota bacterium]|nr:efflux RND transporter periplasmic adaptor subunit [Planctomycetota bacterium]
MSDVQYKIKPSGAWLMLLLGLPCAGLLILVVAGCGNAGANDPGAANKSAAGDDVPRVQTVVVKQQDLERKIELPGTIEGFETADLYAKVGGYLQEISVDIGDRVEAGQVLARLSIPEMHKERAEKQAAVASAEANAEQMQAGIKQAEAEVRSAAARLDEAKSQLQEKQAQLDKYLAEYSRVEGLVQRGSLQAKLLDEAKYERDAASAALASVQARIVTAQAELDTARANADRAVSDHKSMQAKTKLAQAELERVETMLAYGEIRAPFAGVVTKRFFDRGAFIQPALGNSAARPLLTLTRTDKVRIYLDLPMAEVRWLDVGDKAVLDRINVLPGESFDDGKVTRFATSLDMTSRMMRVEIDLDNPEHRLLPGYYGYVTLFLDDFPQTPVIPSSALMAEGNETFVYFIEGDVCRKRIVTTNYQDGTIVDIESGLSGGEHIVQAGGGQIADGQKIVAMKAESGT